MSHGNMWNQCLNVDSFDVFVLIFYNLSLEQKYSSPFGEKKKKKKKRKGWGGGGGGGGVVCVIFTLS
jgi:hypothetical protein